MLYGSANRDEEIFGSDAEEFKITRHPNPHIAFGCGEHSCIGAQLARLEARVLFEVLLGRYPEARARRRRRPDAGHHGARRQANARATRNGELSSAFGFHTGTEGVARRDPRLARGGDDARAHRRGRQTGRRAAASRQGMRAGARRRRPARRRLAERVWRTGLYRTRAVHLLRRGAAGERAHPACHAQHRRADARRITAPRSRSRSSCPAILDGTVEFAIGYSEPSAGSDLASLRTTAVRDGDDYIINGQKMFTSGAAYADYIWLAARTDPTVKKHKGISIFIVPTSSPGFSWKPLHTMPGVSTFYTFYDDVRVPGQFDRRRRERGLEADHDAAELRARGAGQHGCARAVVREDAAVGADNRTRRRPRHRPAVGAAGAGPGRGAGRGLQDHEPAGQRGDDQGRARHGRGIGGQGLRHRADAAGGPRTARGARPRRHPKGRRRAVARCSRIGVPDRGDQHLRRRRQRTSARHHRDGGTFHAARTA